MYTCPGTLENVYAFLGGLDTATGCLSGFREWLMPRFEEGNNLHWSGLVDNLLDREDCPPDQRIARLGELIDEFHRFTSKHEGLTRVYVRYHAWLLTRSWYGSDCPGYIAPHDGMSIPVSTDGEGG